MKMLSVKTPPNIVGFCLAVLFGCASEKTHEWLPGQKIVLINAKTNNGSFEDWSGSEHLVKKRGGQDVWTAEYMQVELKGNQRRATLSIPGWTINAPGESGFASIIPTTHLHRYAFGLKSKHYLLMSDPCGKSKRFVSGTNVNVSFDAVCHFSGEYLVSLLDREVSLSKMMSVGVGLYFDGDSRFQENHYNKPDKPGIRHWLGGVRTPEDHTKEFTFPVRFSHQLSHEEAEAANKNGIRLGISVSGINPSYNIVDNVVMTAAKPGG